MSSAISTVVFDVGNVLIEWNPEHLYRKLIPDAADRAAFLSNVCSMDWNLQQDLGRSWQEAVDMLTRLHPEKADLIAAYDQRWHEMVPGSLTGSVEILSDLHNAAVPLYAITNFSLQKFHEVQERFPFLKTSFLDIVVSAEEQLIKPDLRIYQALISRNRLKPSDCVFIDDSKKNVAAAKEVGMHSIHFSNPQKLREELRDLGFSI